jgi:dihydroneopterin aldolase
MVSAMPHDSDAIFLEGIVCYGYHGVHAEGRALGQRFVVDVDLEADLRAAGESDDLERTISYSAVYRRVREIVEGPPKQLIEAVAEELAAVLLSDFPAQAVTVTVRKPEAPLKGVLLGAAGVRVRRERQETGL